MIKNEDKEYFATPLTLAVLMEGGLGLIAVLVGWMFSRQILLAIHWSLDDLLLAAVVTLPLIGFFLITQFLPMDAFLEIRARLFRLLSPIFGNLSIVDLALISLLSGIGEELLFRGLIQEVSSAHLGLFWGILLTNLIFASIHLVTRLYALLVFFLGAYLSYTFYFTGNLMVPILIHALYNYFSFVFFLKIRDEKKALGAFLDKGDGV